MMAKIKLPAHLREYNPKLSGDVEFSVPETKAKKQSADKKGLFLAAWQLEPHWPGDPVEEYRFAAPERQFRFDFAWPVRKVAVEVDGGSYMVRRKKNGDLMAVGQHNSDEDRDKQNLAAALGWRVLRFSPGQLKKDPAGCVEIVLKALL